MDEKNTDSSKADRKPRGTIIRVGFELIIVFIGVWAALLAENYREKREENESAVAVLQTALRILRDDWGERWRDSVRTEYAGWQARRAEGDIIPPFFFRIPGSEHPPVGIFGAAYNLPDALGPEVLDEMGRRANEAEGVGRRIGRYMELTERTVLPLLAADPSVFYDSASGELLPQYLGQLRLMEEVLAEMTAFDARGDTIADYFELELRRRR